MLHVQRPEQCFNGGKECLEETLQKQHRIYKLMGIKKHEADVFVKRGKPTHQKEEFGGDIIISDTSGNTGRHCL